VGEAHTERASSTHAQPRRRPPSMHCPAAHRHPAGPPSVPRRMRTHLQGQAVERRELADTVGQAPQAVEGELERPQPRQSADKLVHLRDLVVRGICSPARRQRRTRAQGRSRRGAASVRARTEERQGLEARELSRERRELVVGDVQRGHVPVLQGGAA